MATSDMLRPLALVAVIGVVACAFFLMTKPGSRPTIGENQLDTIPATRMYKNATSGLSFIYPARYELVERDESATQRTHHSIVLTATEVASSTPENGESPTTIRVDTYAFESASATVLQWIKDMQASNFSRSADGRIASTTVSGISAYAYAWDGLYRGESIVVPRDKEIVMFSVTSITSTDRIRDDFQTLLSTVHLNETTRE